MASIRQQSNLLCPVVNANQIAASPSTLFRPAQRLQFNYVTMDVLCGASSIIRVCGQFTDENDQNHESVMAVKLFTKKYTRHCKITLLTSQVCTIMVDTISLNTGKKGCS